MQNKQKYGHCLIDFTTSSLYTYEVRNKKIRKGTYILMDNQHIDERYELIIL